MPTSPSMSKLGAAPCLIKAKPLRAALSRAGLDQASARRPWKGARLGRGNILEAAICLPDIFFPPRSARV